MIWTITADTKAKFGYFSPDGHYLVTFDDISGPFSLSEPFSLWEYPAGRKIGQFSPPEGAVWVSKRNHSFSSDHRWIAKSHMRTSAFAPSRLPMSRAEDPSQPASSKQSPPASSDQGRRGEADVSIWDIASGDLILSIKNTSFPTSYCFHPGKPLFAVGYMDGSIQVWDVAAGEELFRWSASSGPGIYVAFTPDGTALATFGGKSSIQFLDIPKLRKQLGKIGLDWPER